MTAESGMSSISWDYVIKFVIIGKSLISILFAFGVLRVSVQGDSGVGKSSLLVRLTDQRFLNHPDPTVSVIIFPAS